MFSEQTQRSVTLKSCGALSAHSQYHPTKEKNQIVSHEGKGIYVI